MRKIELNFSEFDTAAEVHDHLRRAIGSEEYFGSNLDALFDVLTTGGEELHFVLRRVGKPVEQGFCQVFRDAAEENPRISAEEIRETVSRRKRIRKSN